MVKSNLIKKRYITVDKSDSVSKLIGLLKESNTETALVFNKTKFVGVANTHSLLKTKLDPKEYKVKNIIKHIPTLDGDETLKRTAKLLFTGETRMLPVLKNNKVIGVVKSMDLITEIQKKPESKRKIKEIMTSEPVSVKENDSVGKAISIMKKKNISRIPIVDKEGKLINIAAITDFLYKYYLRLQSKSERRGRGSPTKTGTRTIRAFKQKVDLNSFPVKNMATPILVTASQDETINRVIDKMERFNIHSIVVKEDSKPTGIVTTRDFLRLLLEEFITL